MNRKPKLNPEEKKPEGCINTDEWNSPSMEGKDLFDEVARYTVSERKKEARVNIRMTEHELALVRAEADREGIPYQTLMSSILHKYLTGQLLDRRIIDEIQAALTNQKK